MNFRSVTYEQATRWSKHQQDDEEKNISFLLTSAHNKLVIDAGYTLVTVKNHIRYMVIRLTQENQISSNKPLFSLIKGYRRWT